MGEVPTAPSAGEQHGATPPPPQVSPDGRFYWDGRQWAPLAPPPGVTPGSPAAGAGAERSWFARHKVISALGAAGVVVIVAAAINGAREPTTTDPAGGLPATTNTSAAPTTQTSTTPSPAAPPAETTAAAVVREPPASPATTPATEPTYTMPALDGMNLQLAQDTLQALGSYLMDQQDASGLGRVQVIDSNWQVCSQDPGPGSVIPESTLVTLAAVKLDETCP